MIGSRDLEGVHGAINTFDLTVSQAASALPDRPDFR